jgi:hypothetical protein
LLNRSKNKVNPLPLGKPTDLCCYYPLIVTGADFLELLHSSHELIKCTVERLEKVFGRVLYKDVLA